ncbi:MAG: hypothetical protein RLZZ385_464 [Pseudomonadota bacterium]|jgi:glutamyl-Q tRNA(Asp) synthetase
MEDLDPAREPPEAAPLILAQLHACGLHWDGEVLYQSKRLHAYQQALDRLQDLGYCYPCDCSRQRVQSLGSVYDGLCRSRAHPPTTDYAVRLRVDDVSIEFLDHIQGQQSHQLASATGDFVIKRRDGLFAYQLAVVVDDCWQGVTHIVRGHDLLDSTARQIFLQRLLEYPTPAYSHIPVIVDHSGQKLSKQQMAAALDPRLAGSHLRIALGYLGLAPPPFTARMPPSELLAWAVDSWHIQKVPKLASIPETAPSPD